MTQPDDGRSVGLLVGRGLEVGFAGAAVAFGEAWTIDGVTVDAGVASGLGLVAIVEVEVEVKVGVAVEVGSDSRPGTCVTASGWADRQTNVGPAQEPSARPADVPLVMAVRVQPTPMIANATAVRPTVRCFM